LLVLFLIMLIIRFGLGIITRFGRVFAVVTLVLLLVVASLTVFKYRVDYLTRRAVIIAEDCPVYTGASDQSDVALQGSPGLIMEIVSEDGDYYDVLFENKRRGWVKKDLVAEI
ncbi:MAG: hypothetical protein U9R56_06365, partial [candidate division Zixibacteria bacterium]|nr:hypothetical protein [candidate division Zixibacteria bacterium]